MKLTSTSSICAFVIALLCACNDRSDRSVPFVAATPSNYVENSVPFTSSYSSGEGCSTPYDIYGEEPGGDGTFPLFIYMVGTMTPANSSQARAAVSAMVNRGFVGVTVAYPNNDVGDCDVLKQRTQCIFDAASPHSAVSVLCGRDKTDCSKGIVTAGFSQGAALATLAADFDSRLRAAWAMGTGFAQECTGPGIRALPDDRLRAVTGEGDILMGTTPAEVRAAQEMETGMRCGGDAYACFRANGSGWYLVRHWEVADGDADHCYLFNIGGLPQCIVRSSIEEAVPLDPGWLHGAVPWALNPSLDWLASFSDE